MTILTDATVEKALDALMQLSAPFKFRKPYRVAKFKTENASDCEEMRGMLRVCLEAALPDLVEALKKRGETCADARHAAYIEGLREALALIEHEGQWSLDHAISQLRARISALEGKQ